MSVNRNLFTIVCDDVRQEAGNKLSYMGVYGPQLIVPLFPVTLPKLCFIVTARCLVSEPFKKLRFRIMKDDEVLAENDMTAGLPEALEGMPAREHEEILTVVGIFQISPFELLAPCKLRIRADTEAEELRGGTVSVLAPAGGGTSIQKR